MKTQKLGFGIAIVATVLITLLLGCKTTEQQLSRASNHSRLAKEMIGTWIQVGTPGNVHKAPAKGGRYKSRTSTHWSITYADAESGLVKEHFGGTYVIKGDEYIETQHFADDRWLHDNEKSWTFKVKIEGDLMTQIGIGNPYNEIWKRVR